MSKMNALAMDEREKTIEARAKELVAEGKTEDDAYAIAADELEPQE